MNENLKKSLFLNSPAVILGIGIIAPLCACTPLRTNAMLAILAMIAMIISNGILTALRPATPKNGRIGVAVLVTGGLLTIVKVTVTFVSTAQALPVETLAPLMLMTAVIGSITNDYDVKRKLSASIFDGVAIGLSFGALLCLAGVLRDLLGQNTFLDLSAIPWFQSMRIFLLVPGVLLLSGFISFLLPKKKRGAV